MLWPGGGERLQGTGFLQPGQTQVMSSLQVCQHTLFSLLEKSLDYQVIIIQKD